MVIKNGLIKHKLLVFLQSVFLLFMLAGCQSFDKNLATLAAIEAVQAVTLSDTQIRSLSAQAAQKLDSENPVAPSDNAYALRLARLIAPHRAQQGIALNYKVYLAKDVNAFAMADGTVRVYAGLMDILNDEELLFVIGHEVGHVIGGHSKKAAQVAYTASAVRKGASAIGGVTAEIARSEIGALSQQIITAQFSQHEEKDADDFGLQFMRQHGYPLQAAISALRKLGNQGGGLLSSHPNPQARADRLAQNI